ncbi:YusW family protein [Alkalihalobacillus oceani]|uniref:YusW family protein n=1 Tax=Halalkalibacter oceani TaxID=1653776 RepID=UPI00203D6F01|nr:YusW family protein [Halalkalibacter oceani]MCM3763196.1 YusW family protein [Halalkalibacter oceani]
MKLKWITMMFFAMLCFTVFAAGGLAAANIADFELELKLKNNDKYDIEYEVEGDRIEAKYQAPGEAVLYGEEAATKASTLIEALALTADMTEQQVIDRVLSQLNVNQADVSELDIDAEFTDGKQIDIDVKG